MTPSKYRAKLWRWRHHYDYRHHYRYTGENMKNFKYTAISLNMLHIGGLCGVLGFTAKKNPKCPNCLSSNKTVTFGCLIDMGIAYKPYKTPRLIIFWLIFWNPFTNVSFCKWRHYQHRHVSLDNSEWMFKFFCLFVIFISTVMLGAI